MTEAMADNFTASIMTRRVRFSPDGLNLNVLNPITDGWERADDFLSSIPGYALLQIVTINPTHLIGVFQRIREK